MTQDLEGTEEWRNIKGYEGFYQVSSLGKVRSLDRQVRCGRGYKTVKGKSITPFSHKYGYPKVVLSKSDSKKNHYVHRLVAQAFIGEPPRGYVVNHINHICTDNRPKNLEYVSVRENTTHGYKRKNTGAFWSNAHGVWRSEIRIKGKSKYLGAFKSEADAALAYQEALKKYGLENKYAK